MEWLNYNHLQYFWTVVREGGVAAASRKLHVGRPAISMQLKRLEAALGAQLFERRGRYLALTDTGRLVHGYAEEIFRTGSELLDTLRGRPTGRPARLRVGVSDGIAKLVAFRLLSPALEPAESTAIECREGPPRRLLAALGRHELDLVLSDVPIPPGSDIRAYDHHMGESTTTLFAAPALARRLVGRFPDSLAAAPLLLPSVQSSLRRPLQRWLESRDLEPSVAGEFEDSALLKVFGQAGRGVFPAPTVVAEEVRAQYQVQVLGEIDEVREHFWAISPERRVRHPAVARILERAKAEVFG